MAAEGILDDLAFDYTYIARQVSEWQTRRGLPAPPTHSLSNAITSVSVHDTIIGSSTLTIEVVDPDGNLESFFDIDGDGRLDAIELQYPESNGDNWWRLTMIDIQHESGDALKFSFTFLERPAVYLMRHRGPEKRSRGAGTRAQFFKSLVDRVKAGGGLRFVSQQLLKEQQIEDRINKFSGGKLLYAGDSLGVGTTSELKKKTAYKDMVTAVEVGKASYEVLAMMNAKLTDKIGQIVFDAGTNDGSASGSGLEETLQDVFDAAAGRDVIYITIHGVWFADMANTMIRDFVNSHANTYLVEWDAAASDHPELVSGDGIHPTAKGYQRRSDLVYATIPRASSSTFAAGPSPMMPIPPDPGPAGPTIISETFTKEEEEKDPKKDESTRRTKKKGGITTSDLKVQGQKMDAEQRRVANTILDVATEQNAGQLATLAMMCGAIQESMLREIMNGDTSPPYNRGPGRGNGSGYGGVLQGAVDVPGVPHRFKVTDTRQEAYYFLRGGQGYQGGGAKSISKLHPDYRPGLIAGLVLQSGDGLVEGDNTYDQWRKEAEDIIEAYAGPGFDHGTVVTRAQYNFEIEKGETWWDGMQRLAKEVNWRLFVDGNTIYYDDDITLIGQVPHHLSRSSPALLGYQATWDSRRISTTMTMDLICDPFEFRAGEVFLLDDFGMLSRGSTVKLRGRWLITDVERHAGDLFSSFTLAQPERPDKEPDTKKLTRNEDDADEPSEISKGSALDQITKSYTAQDVVDKIVLPIAKSIKTAKKHRHLQVAGAYELTSANVTKANKDHPTNVSNTAHQSEHKGPASYRWAADIGNGGAPTAEMDAYCKALIKAFNTKDLGDWTATSGTDIPGNVINKDYVSEGVTWRFQIIYRTFLSEGGNHYTHVHFGVNRNPHTSA